MGSGDRCVTMESWLSDLFSAFAFSRGGWLADDGVGFIVGMAYSVTMVLDVFPANVSL